VPVDGQVVPHQNPAASVALSTCGGGKCRGERRCLDTGCPQHGSCVEPRLLAVRVACPQAAHVDTGHDRVHLQLNAKLAERLRGHA